MHVLVVDMTTVRRRASAGSPIQISAVTARKETAETHSLEKSKAKSEESVQHQRLCYNSLLGPKGVESSKVIYPKYITPSMSFNTQNVVLKQSALKGEI